MTHVAIVIPGIMGSVLKLNGEEIWPGPLSSLVLPYKKMNQLLDSALIATDIIRSFSISVQYGALVRDLQAWGFKENETLYICAYDWRKSNEDSAEVLAKLIDHVVEMHADAEISLVAHSMGGLIARYYLESGKFDSRPGFRGVRDLITLGTPHRGAPLALTAALGMEKRLFLSADQVRLLVSDVRYPALYQLMPSPQEPFAWDQSAGKALRPVNVYESATATMLGLVKQNVEAAESFRAVLDKGKPPASTRYFFFGGTRQLTTSFVYVRAAAAQKVIKVDVDGAGDGTVPVWSSGLGSGAQSQPVGGEHATIYKNEELRRTLARLLGFSGVLAAVSPDRVQLAVRERVVEPEEHVHLTIGFPAGVNRVEGRIRLLHIEFNEAEQVEAYTPYRTNYPIMYAGMDAETLNVAFDAPDRRGVYKVVFESNNGERLGEDELFVQEPPTIIARG